MGVVNAQVDLEHLEYLRSFDHEHIYFLHNHERNLYPSWLLVESCYSTSFFIDIFT
jgi:hypothetical protein